MAEIHNLTATDLLAAYERRTLAPSEVVAALAVRIEALDPSVRAFTASTLAEASAEAAEADARWGAGTARRLEGIPFAVKDLFDTAGIVTSYGSTLFAGHRPDMDADAVTALRAAGAILVGKTSTHEFAWGLTGWNPAFGAGRNPWDRSRVAGGSSTGSAAAVALGLVPVALGTDTAGSVRLPASFCGLVGLKSTFGRIGLGGVFPLAPSLDHGGVLARSPADARLLLAALGNPCLDSAPEQPARRLRIGVCADLMPIALAAGVAAAYTDTLVQLTALGLERVEVALPSAAGLRPTHGTIQQFEALHVHSSRGLWPERKAGYGADVAGRLAAAEAVTLDQYLEATAAREALRGAFATLFRQVDLLATPVAPTGPPAAGSDTVDHCGELQALRDLVLPFTTPQNLLGLPACAVRAGFDADGLPVGIQLTGPAGSEALVLSVAEALYRQTPELQALQPATAA